jgi:GNAT superfamily N-acetyltransferase
MRPVQTIDYKELTVSMVNSERVEDINRLIIQLAPQAKPCTEAWLHQVLSSGTRIFVAYDDKRIVGTVLLCSENILVGKKYWIEDVVIDLEYARRGIATHLMDMTEEASRLDGAKSINLTSAPDREGARQLYNKRGYVLRETGVFRKTF